MTDLLRNSSQLLDTVELAVKAAGGWRVIQRTPRWVQAIPESVATILPAIGSGRKGRNWFTLEFWIQDTLNGLGVFWWSNPVFDLEKRNRVIDRLLRASDETGIEYGGRGNWRTQLEIPFSGKTVSKRWWPEGESPSLNIAAIELAEVLQSWSNRVESIVQAVGAPDDSNTLHALSHTASSSVLKALRPDAHSVYHVHAARPSQVKPQYSTPPIPDTFKTFRAPPHYRSIFEIYPNETRIYGTEDWHGDWGADILFMAKDAGSSRIFLPESSGGRGWPWITNHRRPTNRNLRPLLDQLRGGKLYGSFLGPLLRNDNRESGSLVMDDRVRAFVKELFLWTVSEMTRPGSGRLRTVAVLGIDAWRELLLAIGQGDEAKRWKQRHLSGEPLEVLIAGHALSFVALNHTAARGMSATDFQGQSGWRWILNAHAAAK